MIEYRILDGRTTTRRPGEALDVDEAIALYVASTLGERRPVADRDRMARMLREANLIVTARDGALLVGISRALSDFSYATYLSDLAVRASHQRQGLGRELIRRTRAAAPEASLILLAAPAAETYYPHVGFERHPQAWILCPGVEVR
jgi:predicted N-acetyltransferase YhbS